MIKNPDILLTIKRVGINGEGIGYYKRKTVFVPFALPEEEVICEIVDEKENYLEGKIKKIKTSSPSRTKAPCPYFGHCGGCQLQHLTYEKQLEAKRDIVKQALERYLYGYEKMGIELKPTIGIKEPYYYRNKAQMPVYSTKRGVETGLYELNSNKIVPIKTCMIQDELINSILDVIKELLTEYDIEVFNRKTRQGVLRYISVRFIETTGEAQVVLVLENKRNLEMKVYRMIAETLMKKFPQVKSFFLNFNGSKNTPEIYGQEFIKVFGNDKIDAKIGETRFTLSPNSFFQLNTRQTKVLYDLVEEVAALKPSDRVIDAYCGAGTIGQYMAKQVAEVRGVDFVPEAIEDAKKNAQLNQLSNTIYEAGKAEVVIPRWIKAGFKPTVLIMDPPRTGVDQSLLRLINQIKVDKLIYVSCNPSTLAKDLNELKRSYKILSIQPIDMFPQTSHVETVVLMSRTKN